jgi:hypothetical protein
VGEGYALSFEKRKLRKENFPAMLVVLSIFVVSAS